MSLAHEHEKPEATEAPARSAWRSFRFPLIVLVIFGSIFAVPMACLALKIDVDAVMPFFMLTFLAPVVAILLIALWWLFFFAGLGWVARLSVFALVAVSAVAAGAVASVYGIRQLELTASPVGLVPRLHFAWETSAEENRAQELEDELRMTDKLPVIDATVGPEDFPRYRGTKLDGVVGLAKLQTDWQKQPPTKLWKKWCPGGYGGVAVAGNIAVTLQQRKKQEVVVCYDRATGRQRWEYAYDAFHEDVMGNGPRSTPTIHNNHVFSIGATGELVCLKVDGKKQWAKNILSVAKAKNIKWGLTGSPLIVDDLVIAHPGIGPDAPAGSSLIAFEQATGEIRWQTGNRKAGYSSPQLAVLGKTRQILLFDGAGLVSYDPGTGKELWQHPWITDWEMNSIQPVVLGNDRVFISSELANGCAMLRVNAPSNDKDPWSVEVLWKNKYLASRYANPVTDGTHIFGLHNMSGVLTCLNVSDGTVKWKGERCGPGQMLLADGVLVVVNGETGDMMLFEADSQSATELARHPAFEKKDKTWNTPALAGDQLFVRNQAEIACFRLPRK
jgi:outer membrane protein assembly factor BamB